MPEILEADLMRLQAQQDTLPGQLGQAAQGVLDAPLVPSVDEFTPPGPTMQDLVSFGLELAPGTGEALAAEGAAKSLKEGDYGFAALEAAGVIPAVGAITRPMRKGLKAVAERVRNIAKDGEVVQILRENGLNVVELADEIDPDTFLDVAKRDRLPPGEHDKLLTVLKSNGMNDQVFGELALSQMQTRGDIMDAVMHSQPGANEAEVLAQMQDIAASFDEVRALGQSPWARVRKALSEQAGDIGLDQQANAQRVAEALTELEKASDQLKAFITSKLP